MPEEKDKNKEEVEVFPFIEGETIDLVAQNSKWAELICKWRNDPKGLKLFQMDIDIQEIG